MASTSECYGDPLINPQVESYWGNVNPIGMRSMYDEAKRFSEACTMGYHRERGAKTRIIRIFNTYGPRMDPHDGRVVISFIKQALHDEPLTVFGDGKQTRSLCYVSDLVRGINGCDGGRLRGADQPRQPERADDPGHRQGDSGADPGEQEPDHVPPDAAGRPEGALPRHHAGEEAARLGADGLPAGGARRR